VTKRKYKPQPPLSMGEMIRNQIKTYPHNRPDKTITLDFIYFLMYGHQKEDVDNKLSKWINLDGVGLNDPVVLPEKFFE
jgi:hypothetical protein